MCISSGPTSVARFESSSPCPICPSALPPWPLCLSGLSPASGAPPLPCAAPPADVSPLLSEYQTRPVNAALVRLLHVFKKKLGTVFSPREQQSRVQLSGWIRDGQGDEAKLQTKFTWMLFSVNYYSSIAAFQRNCNICPMFQKQQLLQNCGELLQVHWVNILTSPTTLLKSSLCAHHFFWEVFLRSALA